MVRRVFKVVGMHCPSCVMRLESIEDEIQAIQSVKADYRKDRMEVVYDEAQIGVAEIVAAVKRKGYEVYLDL